jgi:uncharacterized membrane protein
MKLEGYKLVFVAVGLIGVLLIATPALSSAIPALPSGEQFSELYLLGPDHKAANYPYILSCGQNYSVYVGVGNQLGASAYYVLYVTLGNETDLLPNKSLGTPKNLQPLYEYRFSLQDSENWESLLSFSVCNASISGNNSQINNLRINGVTVNVDKSAIRDPSATFKYQLLFELWLYDSQSNVLSFNDRFVALRLALA